MEMESKDINMKFDLSLQKETLERLIANFKMKNTEVYKKGTFFNFFVPFLGVLSFFENSYYSLKNKKIEENLDSLKETILDDFSSAYEKEIKNFPEGEGVSRSLVGLLDSYDLKDYVYNWTKIETTKGKDEKKELFKKQFLDNKYKLIDTNFTGKLAASIFGMFFSAMIVGSISNYNRLRTFSNPNQNTTINFMRVDNEADDALIDFTLGIPLGLFKYVEDLKSKARYRVEIDKKYLFGYSENKNEKNYVFLKEKTFYKKPIKFEEIEKTKEKIFSNENK